MKSGLTALFSGMLFGLGLAISQMVNPNKVLSFLDITGNWDPSLLVVLVSAVLVTTIGFHNVLQQHKPLFSEIFSLPTKKNVDLKLVGGAIIFGVGWGLGGYCPGPALSALTLGIWEPVIFIVALIAGSYAAKLLPMRQR